jgi:5'-3' exonuclease
VLAGCEYLGNIERVGLKVALKFFDKHKTFDKVLGSMKEHPTYKDRVKPEYE